MSKYNLYKKSYPTYSEIQNMNSFDLEMFDYIDGVIDEIREKEYKKKMKKSWQ